MAGGDVAEPLLIGSRQAPAQLRITLNPTHEKRPITPIAIRPDLGALRPELRRRFNLAGFALARGDDVLRCLGHGDFARVIRAPGEHDAEQ